MNIDEIKHLKKTIQKAWGNANDPIWIQAFREYNEANGKQLGMKCRPCYVKVIQFHISQLKVTA